jgi:hypothetical protein
MERDSRSEINDELLSPFAELRDAEYRWFVALWEDASLADEQLRSPYGMLGGCSAIDLLRPSPWWFANLPIVRERRRERIMRCIREAHGMNRAGIYA